VVTRADVVLPVVTRLLLGPSVMVAAALIVKGYGDVGDGFAAGMVVSLAIALRYIALGAEGAEEALPPLRFSPHAAVGGLLICLAVGFAPVAFGKPMFTHAPGHGEHVVTFGTLELFTPLLFDVGLFFLVVGVMTVLLHQFGHPDAETEEGGSR
jgi:multicomponent Na+:H+ antiporter subunit B